MPKYAGGILSANQVSPTIGSASGIYAGAELIDHIQDGLTPTGGDAPAVKSLRSSGGAIETITAIEGLSGLQPAFDHDMTVTKDGKHLYQVYMVNGKASNIWHYTMSIGWDLNTIQFAGKYVDYTNIHSSQYTFAISNDGTYAFSWGGTTDDLVRYTMAAPYDISTMVEDQRVTDWTTTALTTMELSTDGTKLYTASTAVGIREHTFSSAHDLTTLSTYSSGTNFTDSEHYLDGHYFSFGNSGSTLFINGETTLLHAMLQYDLSTPYDISTATWAKSTSFKVETAPTEPFIAIQASDDGKKLICQLGALQSLAKFELEVAGDIDTVKTNITGKALHVHQSGSLYSITFRPDGTYAYVTVNPVDYSAFVIEIKCATAWEIADAVCTGRYDTKYITSIAGTAYGAEFKPDGTALYVPSSLGENIFQFSMSTAWDLNTLTYVGKFSAASQETGVLSLDFKTDGSEMYVHGSTGDDINQYTLSTPWLVSTASYTGVSPVDIQTTAYGFTFHPDGDELWTTGTNEQIHRHALSTPWDITTMAASSASTTITSSASTSVTNPNDIVFKSDGTKFWVCGGSDGGIAEWDLGTAYDITTVGQATADVKWKYSFDITGLHIDPTGTYVYHCDQTNGRIIRQGMTVADTISSENVDPTLTQSYDCSAQVASPVDVGFSADGTKMYILANGADLYEYSLSTGWDLTSTVTYVRTIDLDATNTVTVSFHFKPDGSILYTLGTTTNGEVNLYNLSTPWDISSATHDTNKVLKCQDQAWSGITLSSDGLHLYLTEELGEHLWHTELGTAWDTSTATFHGSAIRMPRGGSSTLAMLEGVSFNNAGTKVRLMNGYSSDGVSGYTNSFIKTYSLGTAWDLSTADKFQKGVPFALGLGVGAAEGTGFDDDGNHYVVYGTDTGRSSIIQIESNFQTVYEEIRDSDGTLLTDRTVTKAYNMPGPYEGAHRKYFNISGEIPKPRQAYIGNSGTKMYVLCATGVVVEYTLATPNDVRGATPTGAFFPGWQAYHAATNDAYRITWSGLSFSKNGLNFYCVHESYYVYWYTLSSAWDISTLTYQNATTVSSAAAGTRGVWVSGDGTEMFTLHSTDSQIAKWALSTPYDPSSLSLGYEISIGTGTYVLKGGGVSENRLYWGYGTTDQSTKFMSASPTAALTTGIVEARINRDDAWGNFKIWSGSPTTTEANGSHYDQGFDINPGETYAHVYWRKATSGTTSNSQSYVWTPPLDNATDLTTSVGATAGGVYASAGYYNNRKMYNTSAYNVYCLNRSASGATIWSAGTSSIYGPGNPGTTTNVAHYTTLVGFCFSRDGSNLYLADSLGRITQFVLTTPFDTSTAVGKGNRLNGHYSYQIEYQADLGNIDFSDDGKLLFALKHGSSYGSSIDVYELPTAWSLGGMKYTGLRLPGPTVNNTTPLHRNKLANNICVRGNFIYVMPWNHWINGATDGIYVYYINFSTVTSLNA